MNMESNWSKARETAFFREKTQTLVRHCLLLAIGWAGLVAAIGQTHPNERGHLILLPLPPGPIIAKAASLQQELTAQQRQDLSEWACSQPALQAAGGQSSPEDRIVIFVDATGKPVLPNLQAARTTATPGQVKGLTAGNDLSFTYNGPLWTDEQREQMRQKIEDFYPEIKNVYGDPAFANTVNIRIDPSISFAGLYFPSINEMVINHVNNDSTLCHELIHAFRDDYVIWISVYEEGMTRAAEIEVFDRLAPLYVSPHQAHGDPYSRHYEGLNQPAIGCPNGNVFAGFISPLLRYQLSGYAWGKILLENSDFFVRYNTDLYQRIATDPSTATTISKAYQIASNLVSVVEDRPFASWYSRQSILNATPPLGYQLYHRFQFSFVADYFYRGPDGTEINLSPPSFTRTFYDHNGNRLNQDISIFGDFWPVLPEGYQGKIALVTTATAPTGLIKARTSWYWGPDFGQGVFGIVLTENSGVIEIAPADNPTTAITVPVANGAFALPSLENARGLFHARFTGATGKTAARSFTKDASDYLLIVGTLPGDLNEDNLIDASDYAVFRATLSKRLGMPGYNPAADLDGDNVITYRDYQLWYKLYQNFLMEM